MLWSTLKHPNAFEDWWYILCTGTIQGLYRDYTVNLVYFRRCPTTECWDYMAAWFHGIENPELVFWMRIFLFHLHMCSWAMALCTRFPHLHRLSNQRSWELTYVRECDAALNTEAHPSELAAFVIGWVFNLNVAVIRANLEVWMNHALDVDTHTQL